MIRGSMLVSVIALALAAACTPPSGQASPTPTVTATGTPAGSPTLAAGRAELRVVTPENGARAGDDSGAGWSVDILTRGGPTGTTTTTTASPAATASPTATGSPAATGSPTASPSPAGSPGTTTRSVCTPALNAQAQAGRNPAMPGLVVTLSTNADPRQNLAGLFQIVSLDDTERGRQCHAVWFVAQGRFGLDVDAELTAFLVEGDAPATVPADRAGLRIVSNEVTVRFHINGRRTSPSPTGSPATTPTGSPGASPTASPATSPSPSPTRTP